MSNELFEKIVQRLLPIKKGIQIFTLLGLGETLIDKDIIEKIKIVKKYEFKEVGIFSNGMALDQELSTNLLNSGLDVIIFSIDGFSNKVQESIRIGSNLDKIVKNIEVFIEQREKLKAKTKIIIRFTEQEINKNEWDDFVIFWKKKLRNNDAIFNYGLHNVGHIVENKIDEVIKITKCSEVYNRMIIFSDGKVGLCCADQFGHYNIGNILNDDPIDLYNHELFKHYRNEMDKGNILNLELCKDCTVMYSIHNSKHIFI
jgi:radical SAM protein with 4Fe4S-binding SPASM domain